MSRFVAMRPFTLLARLAAGPLAALPFAVLAAPEADLPKAQVPTAAPVPVEIAGSVTFHALAEMVARRASLSPDGADYHLSPTGTVAGIGAFCSGVGAGAPEIVNTSRRMRDDEVALCKANGVDGIVEVKVGYDGVALATGTQIAAAGLPLGVRDLYLALAERVPDPGGADALVANPYRTWHEVNDKLPDIPIEVIGSADASGTQDTLAELGLEAGCAQIEAVRGITGHNRHRMADLCRPLRTDGVWRELPGSDAQLAEALRADPQAVAVTGWHALSGKVTGLKSLPIEGVPPSPLAISTGIYPLTRSLYVYFKKGHPDALPAIQRYVAELTSDAAWGDGGYLAAAGLVPMMVDERQKYGYIAEHWVEPACPPFCR
jgi:phosphate transport system substrate-binding protein